MRRVLIGLLGIACVPLLIVSDTRAFHSRMGYDVHQDITRNAIGSKFAHKKSLNNLCDYNRDTDCKPHKEDPELHFDSEAFAEFCKRLASDLNEALGLAGPSQQKKKALKKIGNALHSLQDFYAHSNWVENHLSEGVLPEDIPLCTELVGLTVDQKAFTKGPLKKVDAFVPDCNPDPPIPPQEGITSGYWPDEYPWQVPTNKCGHGQINKDYFKEVFDYAVPRALSVHNGKKLYDFAYDVAKRHTTALWDNFKTALEKKYTKGTAYYDALVKKQRKVAFVIDVTGSMDDDMPGTQSEILAWVNVLQQKYPDESLLLSLVRFDDYVLPVKTTCLPDVFRQWVNELYGAGGGDCKEASITAMQVAASEMGEDAQIVLGTDAPPRETEAEMLALIGNLKRDNIEVRTLCTPACVARSIVPEQPDGMTASAGPLGVDAYEVIAAATGGMSYDSLADFNIALAELAESSAPGVTEFAIVEGAVAGTEEDSVLIPVDSTVERLDVALTSMNGGSHDVEVVRSDATVVKATDSDAKFFAAGASSRVYMTSPAVGDWTIRITGTGDYRLAVSGISDIAFFDASFARIYEPSGGEYPDRRVVGGLLNMGETFDVEITLLDQEDVGDVYFDLVLPDGSVLEPLTVTPPEAGDTFVAEYTATALIERFYFRATGTDLGGNAFQRVFPQEFGVSSISITGPGAKGTSSTCEVIYSFGVTNNGPADSFTAVASSEHSFPTVVSNPTFTLGISETRTVDVTLTIPEDTPELTDRLDFVVTSVSDPAITNSGSVETLVRSTYDCNCNGVIDILDTENGTSEDYTGNGIPDECEPDCNNNGLPDSRDIFDGTSYDCSENGIPDECEQDCDLNGIADSCDLTDCPAEDPSCQDCDGNGFLDECDIAQGRSADCNGNGAPDECDLSSGLSDDCGHDGVPDECEPDCQPLEEPGHGIPDECDIAVQPFAFEVDSYSTGVNTNSVAVGDFDDDGYLDWAAANSSSNTVSVRFGDGMGSFSGTLNIPVGQTALSVVIGDFDMMNGTNEIAVTWNDWSSPNEGHIAFFKIHSDRTFETGADVVLPYKVETVVAGQMCHTDQAPDLIVTHPDSDQVSFLMNDGAGGTGVSNKPR